MPVKLLISDIDGTLVRPDKSLSDANVAAARHLVQAGIPMTLISARPPSGMHWIVARMGLSGPFGAFNGGLLFNADGTVIAQHHVDAQVARALLTLFAGQDVTIWLFADGDWLVTNDSDSHTAHEVLSAGIAAPIVTREFADRIDRIDKLVAVSDDIALLEKLETKAIALAKGAATIACSQPYYLDVTARVANKGDGVAHLAQAFGVDLAETVVIGDQFNDLPMFRRAGRAFAMGQAPDAVKAAASAVTASSSEDGVARVIETLLAERKKAI